MSYRAIAYVTVPACDNWRWIGTDDGHTVVSAVDTRYVTHLHFAFGMLCGNRVVLQGVIQEIGSAVDGAPYLRALVALKSASPSLKVLLSVGGWQADGFCQMARTRDNRAQFIASLVELMQEYDLDGVDLDWEFPEDGGGGAIAHCPHCMEDARVLVLELRVALDGAFPSCHKLVTVATGAPHGWVWRRDSDDGCHDTVFAALDYLNVMCYDLAVGDREGDQAGLRRGASAMRSITRAVGDSPEARARINMGVPFYNWSSHDLVPYCKPWSGRICASPQLTARKMQWVKANGYGGGFYWAYSMDVYEQDGADSPKIMQRTLYNTLNR